MHKYNQDDLEATQEFLMDYLDYLQENEPHALVCISNIQGALNSLPDEIDTDGDLMLDFVVDKGDLLDIIDDDDIVTYLENNGYVVTEE